MDRRPAPALLYATRAGGTTLDRDALGGNPFATALIQVAQDDRLPFRRLPGRLREVTKAASRGHQVPEWTGWPATTTWTFRGTPGAARERRCALVLVVSDYTAAVLPSLAGAVLDERRIAAMLATHGFSVVQGIAPGRAALLRALTDFARVSRAHDTAVIYCTGHGVEARGQTYLVPGDYPWPRDYSVTELRTRAVSIDRVALACRANALNMVFFAGCRTQVQARHR